ncbi:MAG TPA: hypothetical protein VGR26_03525 [Acidimicrobiales bacterium]|nr:hypothetical protein [Acidimicrobiales bacterium]
MADQHGQHLGHLAHRRSVDDGPGLGEGLQRGSGSLVTEVGATGVAQAHQQHGHLLGAGPQALAAGVEPDHRCSASFNRRG